MSKKKIQPPLRFKDDKGNEFPDWEEKKLKEITKVYDGTHMTPDYKPSGVPFYSVENVTSNDFTNTKFIAEDVYEKECKRVQLEKGDILMTRIGDIGTSKYISWDVKASFYVSLALLKKPLNHNPKYLDQYIKSENFQKELDKRILHVAFPKKINLGEIGECKVLLPCLKEQEKIAEFLFGIDGRIENLEKELEELKAYKKGVMQAIFAFDSDADKDQRSKIK